jgi:fatty-acyl-CoA synthase
MISQRALCDCVRLMPSMFRISSYGRCAFTGTLSFVSGIWGVILPHLYTGGPSRSCIRTPRSHGA